MSVILVSLHCTVGIAMTGIYHLLYVIHVGCTIRVLLYCTVGIVMTGIAMTSTVHFVCFFRKIGCLLS